MGGWDAWDLLRLRMPSRCAVTMGAEMADTEVPVSDVAPRPDPRQKYAAWIDRRWLVRWSGGSSGAAALWAGKVINDSDTGLGDADNDRTGLAMEVESGAELAGCHGAVGTRPIRERHQ